MSGIVALFHHAGARLDRELLARMTAAQRFRGPDAERTWLEPERERVGLGHTLHKATLEAEREVQPAARGGRLFITADARIDARKELCAKLRARGIEDAREDACDHDLILQAYEAWGEACVEHLLGDFSFALWDAPNEKLFCAVDQLGVKPFFYTNRGGMFAGANSLECVRMHPRVRSELSEIAVGDFLLFGCYLERDRTIYEDVSRIAPGHILAIERETLRISRYFGMPEPHEESFASEDDCVDAFRALLDQAVSDRLRTPHIAVYMSGGVDSTLVAQTAKHELARRFSSDSMEAFTIVHEHLMADDERRYATLAASRLAIPIHFAGFDNARLFDWVDQIVAPEPFDWPFGGPGLRQMRETAQRFEVVLTGWDGDALLYASLPANWKDRIAHRRFATLAREMLWYVGAQHGLPPVGFRNRIKAWRSGRSRMDLPSWLEPGFRERTGLAERWARFHADRPPQTPRGKSPHNFAFPGWGALLTEYDASFVACPLETRHPLMDLRLLRFAFGLAAVPWCVDKELLRRCLTELPDAIRKRRKTPLRADPSHCLLRARGSAAADGRWAVPELRSFANTQLVAAALERIPPPAQLTGLLRVVGLGLWLRPRTND